MTLTEDQIAFISKSLAFHGLQTESLKEDLVDHICTTIEAEKNDDFESAYKAAITKLGGYHTIKQLQKETTHTMYSKTLLRTKRAMYVSSLFMVIIFSIGLLFKMFEWPFANIALLSGVSLLLLVYLPLFFYNKYKQSLVNYQS